MTFNASNKDVFRTIVHFGVVPVVVVDSAEAAIPLADTLLQGGLPLVEITFRTAAASEAIRRISKHRPELLVGAGTLVSADNLDSAIDCGARFGVAPGFNPDRVDRANRHGFPFIPGICTPSEIEQAMAKNCMMLKYFPAEVSGGVAMLKGLAGPYKHLGVRFIPTGGIAADNLASYLELDVVAAVGGTWIATRTDLLESNWSAIRDRCKKAVDLVANIRSPS